MTVSIFHLSDDQLRVVESPLEEKIFLEGRAGVGKTTVAVERLLHLMAQGVPGDSILLLVPQRTLATPYYNAMGHPGVVAGRMTTVLTIGGLARRMVDLFWPLVAANAGFARPDELPTFLTLETAQYFMARIVKPLLEEGLFTSVTINRNRLYSQIIDNLNKAAAVGFPHTEIGARLQAASIGELGQSRIYEDAQHCAIRFRQYCLEHNLLDFSLQLEIFTQQIWPYPLCQEYLIDSYQHLIVDNIEEDIPVTHDILREWLPDCRSALLIYDQLAGYRRFLGADPQTAYALRDLCPVNEEFSQSFVTPRGMATLADMIVPILRSSPTDPPPAKTAADEIRSCFRFEENRFYPEMLDWVAEQVAILIHEERVPPGEIVILAPFLPDSLRFSLTYRLGALGVPTRSHRPSRSLREEPATDCLLTLAAVAHPGWGIQPSKFDIAYALVQAIDGLDLVRAQLLTEIVYHARDRISTLTSFEEIIPSMQDRITYTLGRLYDDLREWLESYRLGPTIELDIFLSRLFGEVLSQPGFGFHLNYNAAETTANLIESVQKFRRVAAEKIAESGADLGREYSEMVQEGVVAAQYIRSWSLQEENAVLMAPAYTFLMRNRAVEYQFWLDISSRGWHERIYQPLTHPYVLSRYWSGDKSWTDADEVETSRETLLRLMLGLIHRSRKGIFLGISQLNDQGYEFRGLLQRAIQQVFQQLSRPAG